MSLKIQVSLFIPNREVDVLIASAACGFPCGGASGPCVLLGSHGDGACIGCDWRHELEGWLRLA